MQSTVVLYNRVTLQIKRVAASFDTRRSFRGASLRAIRRVIKLVYILIKKKELASEEEIVLCGFHGVYTRLKYFLFGAGFTSLVRYWMFMQLWEI